MDMKKFIGVAILLSTFGAAQAATDAELSVIGIIKAPACNVAMLNDGVAAFGKIGRNVLSPTMATAIGNRQVDLTVTCDAVTLLAVKVTDNRADQIPGGNIKVSFDGSAVPGPNDHSPASQLGLGKSPTNAAIGAYALAFGKPVIDKIVASHIGANNSGAVRLSSFDTASLHFDKNTMTHFAAHSSDASSNANMPGLVHVFPMAVAAAIDKSGNIPGTEDVELDGSATIEVLYL